MASLMQGEKPGLTQAGCRRPPAPSVPPAFSPFLILQSNSCLPQELQGFHMVQLVQVPVWARIWGPPGAGPQFCMSTFSLLRRTPLPHQTLSLGPHHLWIASSVDSNEAKPEVLGSEQ